MLKERGDLSGRTFGRLKVVGQAGKRGKNRLWDCECSCGGKRQATTALLMRGHCQSCGCLHRERSSERVKAKPPRLMHGLAKTRAYSIWCHMLNRCYNPKSSHYHLYGGRGIAVCERWRDRQSGPVNFLADMGHPPEGHSLDRIDGNADYAPGNCRWSLPVVQSRNCRAKGNTSGFKGVIKSRGRFRAEIKHNYAAYSLGQYGTAEEAAYAYNVGSEILHGDDGVRNDLPDGCPGAASRDAVRARVRARLAISTARLPQPQG